MIACAVANFSGNATRELSPVDFMPQKIRSEKDPGAEKARQIQALDQWYFQNMAKGK